LINNIKNGFGQKYDYYENKLIFEGEFVNGKKNGFGKEYNSEDELIFEGNFVNEMKNGKGKEYNKGQLIFEGEYLKGKKWNGKCKIIDDSNRILVYEQGNEIYKQIKKKTKKNK